MAPWSAFHFNIMSTFLVTTILLISFSATITADGNRWMPMRPSCRGSVAECMGNQEFNLDSESNRRILATSNYISYDALERNKVPCSQRGASYYNCEQGAEANPYDRGCSVITRCRS